MYDTVGFVLLKDEQIITNTLAVESCFTESGLSDILKRSPKLSNALMCNLGNTQLNWTTVGVTPFEFCRDFGQQKATVPGLWCGVVCVRLAVSSEHRDLWQTDTRTDTRRQLIPALASVAR